MCFQDCNSRSEQSYVNIRSRSKAGGTKRHGDRIFTWFVTIVLALIYYLFQRFYFQSKFFFLTTNLSNLLSFVYVLIFVLCSVGIAAVTPETFPTQRISPSGQEGSESSTVVGGVSLDSAWKKKEGMPQENAHTD